MPAPTELGFNHISQTQAPHLLQHKTGPTDLISRPAPRKLGFWPVPVPDWPLGTHPFGPWHPSELCGSLQTQTQPITAD